MPIFAAIRFSWLHPESTECVRQQCPEVLALKGRLLGASCKGSLRRSIRPHFDFERGLDDGSSVLLHDDSVSGMWCHLLACRGGRGCCPATWDAAGTP